MFNAVALTVVLSILLHSSTDALVARGFDLEPEPDPEPEPEPVA